MYTAFCKVYFKVFSFVAILFVFVQYFDCKALAKRPLGLYLAFGFDAGLLK